MNLDDLFEQKNDVAKAVLEELEKVFLKPFFTGRGLARYHWFCL
jgi:hypothetical protein